MVGVRIASLLLGALVACGPAAPITTEDAGTHDAGYGKKPIDAGVPEAEAGLDCNEGDTPSTTYPAAHPTMPQLLSYGGPVLATPRFVPVVFSGEDRTADIAAFTSALAKSSYWSSDAAEYGVGPATASAPIALDETPAAQIDDSQIQTWLQSELDGTHADFGSPDPNAIYVLYYPQATTITAIVDQSCLMFLGYHSETTVGATTIAYAVVARCANSFIPMTAITAHELFEAVTDPRPFSAPAYQHFDDPSSPWGGQEVGDLCEDRDTIVPPDVGYPAVPIWSNVASAAGRDPCQPSPTPYFRTMPESATIALGPGETRTISLLAFSDRPTDPWTVTATPTGYFPDKLTATLCRTTAQNGERIPITISRPYASEYGSNVEIVSKLGDVTTTAEIRVVDP